MVMNFKFIIGLLFLGNYFVNSSINYNNNFNYNMLRLRNTYLRIKLSELLNHANIIPHRV